MGEYQLLLEVLGWSGTLILVLSYLCKTRMTLHSVALVSTIMKSFYCYERKVWPLFANWVALIIVHIYKMQSIYRENRRLKHEKG